MTVADIKARVQEQDAQWDLARQRIIFQVGLQAPSPCLCLCRLSLVVLWLWSVVVFALSSRCGCRN